MNNDLNFMNHYTETLHENFDSIIKQNMVFQTNLKIAEKELAVLKDAKSNVGTLTDENRELKGRIGQLENLMGGLKTVDADKSRLQVALNETSQTTNSLKAEINSLNQELVRLKLQVEQIPTLKKEKSDLEKKLAKQLEDVPTPSSITKPTKVVKTSAGTF